MAAPQLQEAGNTAIEALERIIDMYGDVIQPHIKQEMLHSAREAMNNAIETRDIKALEQILTARQKEAITIGMELRNAQSTYQEQQQNP